METQFKVGDWIIATKPAMRQSISFSFMGSGMVPDYAYMNRPIKVEAVTEAHIIYESCGTGAIISFHELQERGFIIAAPELVNAVKKD